MMDLHLSDDEQQILKHVLHVLYKSFKKDPDSNTGTCRVGNVSREVLGSIIAIHDRIVDYELRGNMDCNEAMKPSILWLP